MLDGSLGVLRLTYIKSPGENQGSMEPGRASDEYQSPSWPESAPVSAQVCGYTHFWTFQFCEPIKSFWYQLNWVSRTHIQMGGNKSGILGALKLSYPGLT